MQKAAVFAFAASAAAQSQFLLPSNPGGAVPAGVQPPSTSGFHNATVQPARGGLAVCVSGFVPVHASTTKNLKFNYTMPKNQSQVTETLLDAITSGSTAMMQLMEGMESVNGTYDIGATLCMPANATDGHGVKGVQLLTHGIGFDRSYWVRVFIHMLSRTIADCVT